MFLCYVSDHGAALIDRELYIPKEWAEDRERRNEAEIPESLEFATKPELARRMIVHTLDAGAAVTWVAADEAQCCGAVGMALNICCTGPGSEDGIDSKPCAATTESATRRYPHSIYNCSI